MVLDCVNPQFHRVSEDAIDEDFGATVPRLTQRRKTQANQKCSGWPLLVAVARGHHGTKEYETGLMYFFTFVYSNMQ